jgi:cytochrome c oxidase subunit I+III
VAAAVALAVLSFGLWVHHMFTTGIPHMALGFFSAASTLVAVPTAVQVFAWIGTLWKGSPRLTLPMLWILAFFATFVIGGLTGVMVAVVPFDWQAHDTHFIVAHLHYVLVGGFVFPMLAALYYWMPHVTGRPRFFKLGETAFWLIAVGFHVTFLAVHWVGLLGQRRRIHTYDEGQGWEVINLIASIGGFVTAIGFALVIVDVALNAAATIRGVRDPWRAGTLEWAMPTPPAAYNFASLPLVRSRDPLHGDQGLPARLARGEGYLADPSRNRRETLAVEIASGDPAQLVVFPNNSALPFVMAVVTGGIFLGMLLKLYWLVPLAALGIAALVVRWTWTLGSRHDAGLQEVGCGLALPLASEVADPPGWWGTLFLLLANATLFGSLLFGYAFLWAVAPAWPPPAYLVPGEAVPPLLLGGAVLSTGGIRLADRTLGQGRSPWFGLLLGLAGLGTVGAAAATLLLGMPHDAHAYGATLWVIGGYVLFHAALTGGMVVFLGFRVAAGYVSGRRIGEARILRLWTDYTTAVALIGLGAAWLPAVPELLR